MALIEEVVTRLYFNNEKKAKWEIKRELITELDGTKFVKLQPHDYGLMRIITQGSETAPKPLPKDFSLTSSIGLRTLIKLRNDAQTRELQADEAPRNPLFRSTTPQIAKRPRLSRSNLKAMRSKPEPLTITIPASGDSGVMDVQVLRPVHPRDDLWVEYDLHILSRILEYLRDEPFDTDQKSKHDKTLPKGVWHHGEGFLVAYQWDGKPRSKKCTSVEAAVVFKANGVPIEGDDDTNEPYDSAEPLAAELCPEVD